MVNKYDLSNIVFNPHVYKIAESKKKSISVIGLDSEADDFGYPFLFCTSIGQSSNIDSVVDMLFKNLAKTAHYVVYNIKYETGAILRFLTEEEWLVLYDTGRTIHGDLVIDIIPNKYIKITRKKKAVHIWDIAQYFHQSLNVASKAILGEEKIDIETKTFNKEYIDNNKEKIIAYCIKDAELTQRLAQKLINVFENFGVNISKLYSTAYVSQQYFEAKINYPYLDTFYEYEKPCIQSALSSYHGGKFEVTRKGCNEFWEYDINSAYPFEIANLYSLDCAKVKNTKYFDDRATYSFVNIEGEIDSDIFHSCPAYMQKVQCYPSGYINQWVTGNEYKYLISLNQHIVIKEGFMIYRYKNKKPFYNEIMRLYEFKDMYKKEEKLLEYYMVKILLNSLYGKMIQLIKKDKMYHAGRLFNPIYAAYITANCRLRVSEMQQKYDSIWAVFTDSVISDMPIEMNLGNDIGQWGLSDQGKGIMIGSGVYQIGSKCKLRGFNSDIKIEELIKSPQKKVEIPGIKVQSWKESMFHNWGCERINEFTKIEKKLDINFDQKRIWLDDYKSWNEVPNHIVESIPRIHSQDLGVL